MSHLSRGNRGHWPGDHRNNRGRVDHRRDHLDKDKLVIGAIGNGVVAIIRLAPVVIAAIPGVPVQVAAVARIPAVVIPEVAVLPLVAMVIALEEMVLVEFEVVVVVDLVIRFVRETGLVAPAVAL